MNSYKKIFIYFSIAFLVISFLLPTTQGFEAHKVLKVLDGDTFYIDLNNNNIPDKEERIRLYGVDAFETRTSKTLYRQMNNFNFSKEDILKLGNSGKNFAKQKLLNKKVRVEIIKEQGFYGRKLALLYINNEDFNELLLKQGLAVVYRQTKKDKYFDKYIKLENFDKIHKNLGRKILTNSSNNKVVLNINSHVYHSPNCKFAKKCTKNCKTINILELPKDSKYCSYCRKHKLLENIQNKVKSESKFLDIENTKTNSPPQTQEKEEPTPDIKTENIALYFINPTKYNTPANFARTAAAQALLKEINNSKESIYFAIYGIAGQPEIINALINAQKRGVKIKWVTDMTENNYNIYQDTKYLIQSLPNVKTDYAKQPKDEQQLRFKYTAIMHNKFFIFDKKKVWTGSTNISSTGIGGYNSNVGILINSEKLSELYLKEFNQMFEGIFHRDKNLIQKNKITLSDKTELLPYFLPADKNILEDLVSLISKSTKYVYMPIFYLTHPEIVNALIQAKQNNVDVKLIVDATSAQAKYSHVDYLRKNNVLVKVENWGGKMHMKSIIIDNKTVAIGSMNFTKQGHKRNDENIIIINNEYIATKYKDHFLELWNKIPDKWLYKKPKAESLDSINSCTDGIDNDHDGYIDLQDFGCRAN